jgi:hypothetical protein
MRQYQKTILLAVAAGTAASFLMGIIWFFNGADAATFDSDLIPSSTATYSLGASDQVWSSINQVIYFSGSNVGIGVSGPGQVLEINGGLRLNTSNAKPTCDSSQRGTFWVTQAGSGVKDDVQVCAKDASDAYDWRTIY